LEGCICPCRRENQVYQGPKREDVVLSDEAHSTFSARVGREGYVSPLESLYRDRASGRDARRLDTNEPRSAATADSCDENVKLRLRRRASYSHELQAEDARRHCSATLSNAILRLEFAH
jgi:hypothetical protein